MEEVVVVIVAVVELLVVVHPLLLLLPPPPLLLLLQRLLSWVSMLLRKEAASSNGFDNSSLYLISTRQYVSWHATHTWTPYIYLVKKWGSKRISSPFPFVLFYKSLHWGHILTNWRKSKTPRRIAVQLVIIKGGIIACWIFIYIRVQTRNCTSSGDALLLDI